jgi:hypothetical protein
MKGWKTVVFGILTILLSIFSSPDVQAFVAEHLPAVGSAFGAIVIVLRALTSSSVFSKNA